MRILHPCNKGQYMITITHTRPTGAITIEIESAGTQTKLTRTSNNAFAAGPTSMKVDTSYDETVDAIRRWSDGEYAQTAFPMWGLAVREWLITGFLPGTPLNPLNPEDEYV